MEKYRFLEHTADVFIEAEGKDLAEAFENVASGLMKLMIENIEEAKGSVTKHISVEGEDLQALLFEFLTQFLVLHDSENLIFTDINVEKLEKNDKWHLEAKLKGEDFDAEKHQGNVHVKAITYHEMSVVEETDGAKIKVLVDI